MRDELLTRFAGFVGDADAEVPLLDAALTCAAYLQDGNLRAGIDARIDALVAGVKRACVGAEDSPRARARALLRVMADEGWCVPSADRLAVRDLLLDRVIDSRTGAPIALAILAVHVASKADVVLDAVLFPGAVFVGTELDASDPFIHDFVGNSTLQLAELAERYASVKGRPTRDDEPDLRAWIAAASTRLLLAELLRRLRRTQANSGSQERLADTLELEALLQPEVDSLRELANEHARRRRLLH